MGLAELRSFFDQGNLKEALDHVEEIENNIRAEHPDFFEFKLLNARILLEMGRYEEGEKLLNSLLDLGRKGGLLVRIDLVILLSDILWRKGNWDQAFFMIEMGEYEFTNLGDRFDEDAKDRRYAELKRLKGIYYRYSGELEIAIEYFQECLFTAEKIEDKRLLAKIYNLLGLVYHENGDLSKSWAFFLKSYEMHSLFEEERGLAITTYNLAGLQEYIGDFEQAQENFEISLGLSKSATNLRLEANSTSALGILLLKKGEFHEGIHLVNKGLTIKTRLGNDIESSWTFYKLLKYLIYSGNDRYVPIYLDEMEEIFDRNSQNLLINQHYRLIKASIYSISRDKNDRNLAKSMFMELARESIIHLELTLHAMLSLVDLLIEELIDQPSPGLIREIDGVIDILEGINNEQYSLTLIIEISVILSKFNILAQNYQFALDQISASLDLIEKKDFHYLENKVQSIYQQALTFVESSDHLPHDSGDNLLIMGIPSPERAKMIAEMISSTSKPKVSQTLGILFLITDTDNNIIFNIPVNGAEQPDDDKISQILNAVNRILKDSRSQTHPIDMIKYDAYHIISKNIGKFLIHYIYQGDSSINEIHKVDRLIENLLNLYSMEDQNEVRNIDAELIAELLQ